MLTEILHSLKLLSRYIPNSFIYEIFVVRLFVP